MAYLTPVDGATAQRLEDFVTRHDGAGLAVNGHGWSLWRIGDCIEWFNADHYDGHAADDLHFYAQWADAGRSTLRWYVSDLDDAHTGARKQDVEAGSRAAEMLQGMLAALPGALAEELQRLDALAEAPRDDEDDAPFTGTLPPVAGAAPVEPEALDMLLELAACGDELKGGNSQWWFRQAADDTGVACVIVGDAYGAQRYCVQLDDAEAPGTGALLAGTGPDLAHYAPVVPGSTLHRTWERIETELMFD